LERSLGVRVDELQPILSALTGRLLRVVPREGAEQVYELAHEYLVAEIHLSAEALARKQAEELITQGVDNWKRLGTLLGKDTLALIDERLEVVHPSLDAQELLLRSAIQHRRDVSYWAERMDANWRAALIQQLLADFDGPECPAREQATEALWALKRYLAWSVCVRVAWALAQQQSSAMIKRYALPVGFVLLLGIFLMASVIYVLNLPIPEKMVEVPAGEFIMGSTPEEVETRIAAMKETTTDKKAQEWWTGIFASEMPTRTVYVETFFVDKYEVTNAQYQRCVTAGVCKAPASWAETGTYPDGQGDYPVVNVSWQDADTYCQWAGRRLPTEVEWEKAARGTDGRRYPWGNEWEDGRANIKQGDRGAPTGVNSFLRDVSPYKVYNMAGNVWEWTASSWVEEAPFKVIRGGYWLSEPHRARCAARAGYPPDGSLKGAGVRCVSDQLWKPRGWREFIASVWR
jgi:sulfatase modifying factor 1